MDKTIDLVWCSPAPYQYGLWVRVHGNYVKKYHMTNDKKLLKSFAKELRERMIKNGLKVNGEVKNIHGVNLLCDLKKDEIEKVHFTASDCFVDYDYEKISEEDAKNYQPDPELEKLPKVVKFDGAALKRQILGR